MVDSYLILVFFIASLLRHELSAVNCGYASVFVNHQQIFTVPGRIFTGTDRTFPNHSWVPHETSVLVLS